MSCWIQLEGVNVIFFWSGAAVGSVSCSGLLTFAHRAPPLHMLECPSAALFLNLKILPIKGLLLTSICWSHDKTGALEAYQTNTQNPKYWCWQHGWAAVFFFLAKTFVYSRMRGVIFKNMGLQNRFWLVGSQHQSFRVNNHLFSCKIKTDSFCKEKERCWITQCGLGMRTWTKTHWGHPVIHYTAWEWIKDYRTEGDKYLHGTGQWGELNSSG